MDSGKGFFERFPFPLPWIVSAALALGAGAVILLPSIVAMAAYVTTGTRPPPTHFDAVWEAIWLVALILVAGYVLEALATPMYQILEGYRLWPRWFRDIRRRRHVTKRNRLQRHLDIVTSNQNSASFEAFDVVFIEGRLAEYPVQDSSVAPTRLGNLMRAMEGYGVAHYELDSQLLWYELTTVAPEPLRMELMRSRQSADFFVGTVFTSSLFATVAVVTGVLENVSGFANQPGVVKLHLGPIGRASVGPLYVGLNAVPVQLGTAHILLGLIVLLIVPFMCYRVAIEMIKMWAGVVRALVNLGRIQLADSLGLVLPKTHEKESELWRSLCGFVERHEAQDIARWAEYLYPYRSEEDSGRTGPGGLIWKWIRRQ